MESYQHSSPVPSPRIHVHNEDTAFVMDRRYRRTVTPKFLLKGALGLMLLMAAFVAVNNNSSTTSRLVAYDVPLLGKSKSEATPDGMPKPKQFDWEKIESKGEYNWQKCKESSDPDCWKEEGDRVHNYWQDFGLKMKTYWRSFGERMHNFWAGVFGPKNKADSTPPAIPPVPAVNETEPIAP